MFVITHCVLYRNVSPEVNSRKFQYVRSSSTKEGVSLNCCLHLMFVNVTQSGNFHTHSFSTSQNFTHSGYFFFFKIIILVNGHNNKNPTEFISDLM